MKKLIFIPFLFLSTISFGINPTLLSYQNVWLFKKMKSLFQQNNFQANIAASGDKFVSPKDIEEPSLREIEELGKIIENQNKGQKKDCVISTTDNCNRPEDLEKRVQNLEEHVKALSKRNIEASQALLIVLVSLAGFFAWLIFQNIRGS